MRKEYCYVFDFAPDSEDSLLLDWGLHHIHLFLTNKRNQQNDNILLFIMKQSDTIYFIDILTHQDFFNFNLLEIIHRNWKTALEPYKVNITPDVLTEKNFRNLRKNNVGYTIGFLDEPKIAYATQKRNKKRKDYICFLEKNLELFQQNLLNDSKRLADTISSKTRNKIVNFELKMVRHQNSILFIEPNYNVKINFENEEQSIEDILRQFCILK